MTLCDGNDNFADFLKKVNMLLRSSGLEVSQRGVRCRGQGDLPFTLIEQQLISCADTKLLWNGSRDRQLALAGHFYKLQETPSSIYWLTSILISS